MSTRRDIITGAFTIAGTAAIQSDANSAVSAAPDSPDSPDSAGAKYPITESETYSKLAPVSYGFPPGDVRRFGIVANVPTAATLNTKAFRALVAPEGTFTGFIFFPNVTGADVYHFDGMIAIHDNVHIDLLGSKLRFHKISEATDRASGFLFPLRDFHLENGSIIVDYEMGSGVGSAGSAIHIGNRGTDSFHAPPIYDSELPVPMGNIVLRNLRITSNVPKGNAIEMTGGLTGVTIENVWIDGQGQLNGGIYYEFGWATRGTADLRETSHAHNLRLVNITISNLNRAAGSAITLAGAYNSVVDGLYVNGAAAAFTGTTGESLNCRPWKGVDQVGAKRTIVLRNIIAARVTATAIWFTGAQKSANGYLAKSGLGIADQTDLADYSMDGFAIEGTSNGWGIMVSANKVDIRNGRITGFQRGIVQSDDCTRIAINSVDVFGCDGTGIQLHMGGTLWVPPREKMGEVRNCFISGNSKKIVGASPGIDLDMCAGFLIQNNRIGFEKMHDGHDEPTQGNAIQLGSRCSRVLCIGNYVGGVSSGSVAYYAPSNSGALGNTIQLPGGIMTTHGPWEGLTAKRQVVVFAPSITINATGSEQYEIEANRGDDFTVKAPSNPVSGKVLCITVRNSSNGALGHISWDPVFKMSPWTSPASGHNRSITLYYDGSHWLQISQTGVDIPN